MLGYAVTFTLGLLVGGVAVVALSARLSPPANTRSRQRPAQRRYRCEYCTDAEPTREDMRDHLRDVHSAPGDDALLDELYAEETPEVAA